MQKQRLENLKFELDETKYELGFTFETAKQLANLSISKQGKINDLDFFKVALKAHSNVPFVLDGKVKVIYSAIREGLEFFGEFMEFDEISAYVIALFLQAIEEKAMEYEPADIVINKDNSVKVIMGEKTYDLKFNRKDVTEQFANANIASYSLFDLFSFGSSLVRLALDHYTSRVSTYAHEDIFLSLWATQYVEGREHDLAEVMNALVFHMNEVAESALKKSSGVIKALN